MAGERATGMRPSHRFKNVYYTFRATIATTNSLLVTLGDKQLQGIARIEKVACVIRYSLRAVDLCGSRPSWVTLYWPIMIL